MYYYRHYNEIFLEPINMKKLPNICFWISKLWFLAMQFSKLPRSAWRYTRDHVTEIRKQRSVLPSRWSRWARSRSAIAPQFSRLYSTRASLIYRWAPRVPKSPNERSFRRISWLPRSLSTHISALTRSAAGSRFILLLAYLATIPSLYEHREGHSASGTCEAIGEHRYNPPEQREIGSSRWSRSGGWSKLAYGDIREARAAAMIAAEAVLGTIRGVSDALGNAKRFRAITATLGAASIALDKIMSLLRRCFKYTHI